LRRAERSARPGATSCRPTHACVVRIIRHRSKQTRRRILVQRTRHCNARKCDRDRHGNNRQACAASLRRITGHSSRNRHRGSNGNNRRRGISRCHTACRVCRSERSAGAIGDGACHRTPSAGHCPVHARIALVASGRHAEFCCLGHAQGARGNRNRTRLDARYRASTAPNIQEAKHTHAHRSHNDQEAVHGATLLSRQSSNQC
jgi:hypothetical protein